MARYRVGFTEEARAQVLEVSRWWKVHRPSRPGLFREELLAAKEKLARFPTAGPQCDLKEHSDVRQLLLLRTQYYVYYSFDPQRRVVLIFAVWHTARGTEPPV